MATCSPSPDLRVPVQPRPPTDDPNAWVESFSIVTTRRLTDVNDDVGHIHDRMPMTIVEGNWTRLAGPRPRRHPSNPFPATPAPGVVVSQTRRSNGPFARYRELQRYSPSVFHIESWITAIIHELLMLFVTVMMHSVASGRVCLLAGPERVGRGRRYLTAHLSSAKGVSHVDEVAVGVDHICRASRESCGAGAGRNYCCRHWVLLAKKLPRCAGNTESESRHLTKNVLGKWLGVPT